jgi:hypothetical protein
VVVLSLVAVLLLVAALASPVSAAAGDMVSTKSLLAGLTVSGEHSAGYERGLFPLWDAAGPPGCDTRDEVLITEATRAPTVGTGCKLTGGKWLSRYDDVTVTDPSQLDIDHLVPLAEAWQSGAYAWTTATRERYANDLGYPADLVAVTAHANRSKGDDEPSAYLPPEKSFDCRYEAWWVAVKWRWHLSVDSAEKSWLSRHLARCGWPKVVRPGRPHIDGSPATGGGHAPSTHGVTISRIQFDSPGSDTGSNHSRNAEWIRLANPGHVVRYLHDWTVHDASSHVYTLPAVKLASGHTVTIHSGSGKDSSTDLYWAAADYIWNNTGDSATLRNAAGGKVDQCSYTAADDPTAHC